MVTIRKQAGNAPFRAIADPTRREILGLLRSGPQTVGELARNFRTSRPAISKHLRLLRSAGLVTTQKDGAAHICHLNAGPLRTVSIWLREYEVFWAESLRGLKNFIEGAANQKERE
jgi:DNA-binding transcriptional ArsR family regulator